MIDLALRDDEVIICRAGQPIAVLTAIPKADKRTIEAVWALVAEQRPTDGDQTSNHDDFYDDNGLPK